ncbi:hypothetical protein GCM10012275_43120 [Longimycelium tulufanense]|uniref:DUF3558 domain-containing protein n=1 Tax=Longimycelium tulufanense TaxID=907463 RepID=A0A8J3CGZ5_9PSEU|nr:DUF3558 family protein [Longimycelium tulufanense]GGM67929.1 hypothetical protein GCM10012275_43120 [Longimycelium tulufanense]
MPRSAPDLVRWIAVAAAGLAVAACSSTSGTALPAPSSGSASESGPASPAPLRLGDLNPPPKASEVGAPFDPCEVGWAAFPETVRPEEDRKPTRKAPGPKDLFKVDCRWDNSGAIEATLGDKPQISGPSTYFIAHVVWGDEYSTDPAEVEGSQPTQIAGKHALRVPREPTPNGARCVVYLQLAKGVAAVSILNGRFPKIEACAIARTVAEVISRKTS